jgi:Flp pilus assembly protein TadG
MRRPRHSTLVRRFLRSRSGSVVLEGSLLFSISVMVIAGIIDYALAGQRAIEVFEAASAGAAYGVVPGNAADSAGMSAAAQAAAPDVTQLSVSATTVYRCTPSGANVTSSKSCSGYGTPIEYVVVSTSAPYPYPLRFDADRGSNSTAHATAMYRVPWTP